MGEDKYESKLFFQKYLFQIYFLIWLFKDEELLKYAWPEDIWYFKVSTITIIIKKYLN